MSSANNSMSQEEPRARHSLSVIPSMSSRNQILASEYIPHGPPPSMDTANVPPEVLLSRTLPVPPGLTRQRAQESTAQASPAQASTAQASTAPPFLEPPLTAPPPAYLGPASLSSSDGAVIYPAPRTTTNAPPAAIWDAFPPEAPSEYGQPRFQPPSFGQRHHHLGGDPQFPFACRTSEHTRQAPVSATSQPFSPSSCADITGHAMLPSGTSSTTAQRPASGPQTSWTYKRGDYRPGRVQDCARQGCGQKVHFASPASFREWHQRCGGDTVRTPDQPNTLIAFCSVRCTGNTISLPEGRVRQVYDPDLPIACPGKDVTLGDEYIGRHIHRPTASGPVIVQDSEGNDVLIRCSTCDSWASARKHERPRSD